jgi:dihydroorotate dehydrogenase
VIASGGAGKAADVGDALMAGAAAVAIASVLHYNVFQDLKASNARFDAGINLAHLDRPGFARIQSASLPQIKREIALRGFNSRTVEEAYV